MPAPTPTPDLAARVQSLRNALAPRRDPDLHDAVVAVRAQLDPDYRRELEAEHRYRRARVRAAPGGAGSIDEQARCEWCYSLITHRHADCASCGHQPDLAIGHRQTKRTAAQQKKARDARARRKRAR